MTTNALFAEWLRSATRESISSNFQRNNFKAAKSVDEFEEVIASADDALKVHGIGKKMALQWDKWYQEYDEIRAARMAMTPSQNF